MSTKPIIVSQQEMNIVTAMPTPPGSPQDNVSPLENFSISTTFFPGAKTHPTPSDLALLSSDSVFFYIHTNVLLERSENNFNFLLPAHSITQDNQAIILVNEASDVLNILLHAIYDLSCAKYAPALSTLTAAVSSFTKYGLEPAQYIYPSSSLFTLCLSHAPTAPIQVYALAAQHGLHDLAVSASSHLLSLPLHAIDDEAAKRIGALYLKRLFFLHLGRTDALKQILLAAPRPHSPTPGCDFAAQKKLARAWAAASAPLAWEAHPDIPGSALECALLRSGDGLWCEECRESLLAHIRALVVQWAVVKRTI